MKTKAAKSSLTRFAWLSIAAAIATITLKSLAYILTGSVGLLSDALESLINLAGAVMALAMLRIAIRPADDDHNFGHSKAEYFSSGTEGILIIIAAVLIIITAIERLFEPRPLDQISTGMAVSLSASVINLVVSLILRKAGRKYRSITLEADAKHLMTDVWTSAGVLIGIAAVALTGINRIDPIVALFVAANIIFTGIGILKKSIAGLMDKALDADEYKKILDVLHNHTQKDVHFHAVRTRQAGAWQFVSFHVLVPGSWTVAKGHELLEEIEADLTAVLPNLTVITHLEPIEDPVSYEDIELKQSNRHT